MYPANVLCRSVHWWYAVVNGSWNDDSSPEDRDMLFVEHFRMSHGVFHDLCDKLRLYIQRKDTKLRAAIPVELRVAVAVFRLAHGLTYKAVQVALGTALSTSQKLCCEVYDVICEHLQPEVIKFPTGDRLKKIMMDFEHKKHMPMCCGAVDGSHIPIQAPFHTQGPLDYRNRKGFYSIVLQGCVDFDTKFISINVGFPGRAHDSRLYRRSSLCRRINAGTLLPDVYREIEGVRVYPYILGDAAYGLNIHLMKGFPGAANPIDQEWFTFRLSSARMCVERAFGMLKGRWRIFQKPSESKHIIHHCRMTAAACVLHNLCVDVNVDYNRAWEQREGATQDDQDRFTEPAADDETLADALRTRGAAKQIQQALCKHMMHNYHAGWQPRSREVM